MGCGVRDRDVGRVLLEEGEDVLVGGTVQHHRVRPRGARPFDHQVVDATWGAVGEEFRLVKSFLGEEPMIRVVIRSLKEEKSFLVWCGIIELSISKKGQRSHFFLNIVAKTKRETDMFDYVVIIMRVRDD